MVSIRSMSMLLVVALVAMVSAARLTSPRVSLTAVVSQSRQELRANDTNAQAAWGQALRTDAVHAVHSSIGKRDEGRDRSTSVNPAWIPLTQSAAHASLTAGLVLHARASALRAPGLPAPSSRAPPVA